MKKLILLSIFVLFGLFGCKKIYIVNEEPVNIQMIKGSAVFTFNKTKVTLLEGQWYKYEGVDFKVTSEECLTNKCVYMTQDGKGYSYTTIEKI